MFISVGENSENENALRLICGGAVFNYPFGTLLKFVNCITSDRNQDHIGSKERSHNGIDVDALGGNSNIAKGTSVVRQNQLAFNVVSGKLVKQI